MTSRTAEERFGDLLLLARWHRGPCTEVFVARPAVSSTGPLAIVKRVLPHARDDARVRGEFDQEARLLGSLNHPSFPRLLGRGERHGVPFLVLEFLAGPTVRTLAATSARLERGPEWSTAVMALGCEALGGLSVLHRHRPPIVHRDVSPENLLLRLDGSVAILDLGVAKVGAAPLDEPVGKRAYMSPEHLDGRALDGRADLYALGVVLWELLAGTRPRDAFGKDGRLAALSRLVPTLDPTAGRLVERLAHPDPAGRPASAGVARRSFLAWLNRAGVSEPRDVLRLALERLFDADARAAWSPDPTAWTEARRVSAEERGEETTNRPGVVDADITEVVEPPGRPGGRGLTR